MLECIDDKVKIYLCGERDATVFYINSLPGITIESIESPTEQEQVSFTGAWRDILAEAKSSFNLDLMTELNACREFNKDCDYDAIFCTVENTTHILPAWKYKIACTLLEYRIYSTRINRFTLFDRDKAIELLKFYQQKYSEALKHSVMNLDLSLCCLDCSGNPQFVTWLP